MKRLTLLAPFVIFASCASTPPTTPEERFRAADKDGDGSVERNEAVNLTVENAFKNIDSNGDGYLDQAEVLASGGNLENFNRVNKSKTGKITLEEAQADPKVFNTFAVSFDEADTNKDGRVTLTEYQDYVSQVDALTR
ncbi:EF-hand domain-containing protein [Haloferula sp.]|uniref:EF-hand domain-containing protein n=1 Tax=Haloferula sp. TaxID=2497595 RepID=UPI00329E0A25